MAGRCHLGKYHSGNHQEIQSTEKRRRIFSYRPLHTKGELVESHAGSVYSTAGTLTITDSTISGNSADSVGGGIYSHDGTSTITNSTISGNSAGSGGGIYSYSSTLTIANSTISDKYLVTGKASYMGTYFARTMYEGQYRPMGNLVDVLQTGRPLHEGVLVYGDEWRSQAKTMIPGQHEGSLATANYLMKKKILNLSGSSAFLDLGCGSGAYSIAACQAYPQLKACCVDFVEILEVTTEYIEATWIWPDSAAEKSRS